MQTITHGHSDPPPGPNDTLATFLSALNVADHAMVVVLDPVPADLGGCDYGDPAGKPGVAVATITWTNRFGRPVSRSSCALCVSSALIEATSDGRDVTVRAAAESVR